MCEKRKVGHNTGAQIRDANVYRQSVCAKKRQGSTQEDIIYQRVWKYTRDYSVTARA